jgi:hypothetical protein
MSVGSTQGLKSGHSLKKKKRRGECRVPKADRKNRLREAWGLRKENGQKVQVVVDLLGCLSEKMVAKCQLR